MSSQRFVNGNVATGVKAETTFIGGVQSL
ncbi:MAG: hypothetical protein RJA15_971, partial [Actinomycetota bacterium]